MSPSKNQKVFPSLSLRSTSMKAFSLLETLLALSFFLLITACCFKFITSFSYLFSSETKEVALLKELTLLQKKWSYDLRRILFEKEFFYYQASEGEFYCSFITTSLPRKKNYSYETFAKFIEEKKFRNSLSTSRAIEKKELELLTSTPEELFSLVIYFTNNHTLYRYEQILNLEEIESTPLEFMKKKILDKKQNLSSLISSSFLLLKDIESCCLEPIKMKNSFNQETISSQQEELSLINQEDFLLTLKLRKKNSLHLKRYLLPILYEKG